MNKLFLLFSLLIFCFPSWAKFQFIWSGVAGVYLTDGESHLYFDPVFSRPSIPQILLGLDYEVDENFVQKQLDKLGIQKVDGIFIGHSHFDHAIDMHAVQKLVGGTIHGTQSTLYLAQALKVSDQYLKLIQDEGQYQIGKFTVIPLLSEHGKILDLYEFQGGILEKPLSEKPDLGDYVMGGSYSFFISHPEGNFLVQQSTRTTPNVGKFIAGKEMKVIFQGIANRRSSKELYADIISKAKSVELIVPIHHDNFFLQKDTQDMSLLWGVKLEEFVEYSKSINQKVILPVYDQRYAL